MCGIIGYISPSKTGFSIDERGLISDLLYMDSLRGWDATGVFYGNNRGDVQIHKAAMPGPMFMSTQEWMATRGEMFGSGKWFVGHNRAATRGEKVHENAHPFIVDNNIVLCQNGTMLGSHHHLAKVDVDSHACAHAISEAGADLEKAFKRIDAAFAFVWWNHEEERLYLIRNDERPLHIGYTTKGGVAFASERDMLLAAATRNDIEFKETPYLIKPGLLCTFQFKNGDFIDQTYTEINITPEKPQWSSRVFPFSQRAPAAAANEVTSHRGTHTRQQNSFMPRISPVDGHAQCFPDEKELMDQPEFSELSRLASAAAARGVRYTVEGLDYACISPTDYNCNQFFIYGEINDPDGVLQNYHVFWTIEAEDQESVINYIKNNMFTGTISPPHARKNDRGLYRALCPLNAVTAIDITTDEIHETVH